MTPKKSTAIDWRETLLLTLFRPMLNVIVSASHGLNGGSWSYGPMAKRGPVTAKRVKNHAATRCADALG